MCRALLVCLLSFCSSLRAQSPDWQHLDVNNRKLAPDLQPASLTPATKQRMIRSIKRHIPEDSGACISLPDGPEPTFKTAPLGRPPLYVVTAGAGCGGNVNTPGWLIQMHGERPVILADLSGWGFGVQPHKSHDRNDFVVAWHNGFDDFTLRYLRFDGKRYRVIGNHEVIPCHADSDDPHDLCYREGGRPRNTGPIE
jgi:hypothetical protein